MKKELAEEAAEEGSLQGDDETGDDNAKWK